MIELRGYQRDLLTRLESALASPSPARIMIQLPTGGGKTCIAGELLLNWLTRRRKAVWLTHRRELAAQTEGMLQEAGVTATANIQWTPRSYAPSLQNGVVILMAQTVSRRNSETNVWNQYGNEDLLIIDEAHHATADGWARAIRQWRGSVVGMTATPWRLSLDEGFDHLFNELICGPQIHQLQLDKWLCPLDVKLSPEGERVLSGRIDRTGDYSESGIELANEGRDVWTVGALRFWQKHCANRQTVIYAVSVQHARNLVAVFNDAGISAGLLIGDTPAEKRAGLIQQFQARTVQVLINVAVATEGFDLPDATCVMMTRPTMSLSLYLQMVGRGLRPKENDGNCIVLDLAGNSARHGLPEGDHEWSLQPRAEQASGGPWVIWCPECESLSPVGWHQCTVCEAPFGKLCARCGAWRAWKRWTKETICGRAHDLVCDLCHYDAHIQSRLPVTEDLKELTMLVEDDELSPDMSRFLKTILEQERLRLVGDSERRKEELRSLVNIKGRELADEENLDSIYESYLEKLPAKERPRTRSHDRRLFNDWRSSQERELAEWTRELTALESQSVNGELVFRNTRHRLIRLLETQARYSGLLPLRSKQGVAVQGQDEELQLSQSKSPDGWRTFAEVRESHQTKRFSGFSTKPTSLRIDNGEVNAIGKWSDILLETAEWLVTAGLLARELCPVAAGKRAKRHLVHIEPVHPTNEPFKYPRQLSNGLYVECGFDVKGTIRQCEGLLEAFSQDPEQFRVRLG